MIITRTTNKGERRYLVRVYTGLAIGSDGRPRRKYLFRQFARMKEAETWEREQEQAKGKGALVIPSKQQLRDFLRGWLDGPKKAEVREATWQDYEEKAARWVLPLLGTIPVDRLGARQIVILHSALHRQGLSPRTIRYAHQIVDHALERIEEGTFGLCEQCGESISIKRLEARLETTLCIRCKEDQERMEKAYG